MRNALHICGSEKQDEIVDPPNLETSDQKAEARIKGGNPEPNRESLQAGVHSSQARPSSIFNFRRKYSQIYSISRL